MRLLVCAVVGVSLCVAAGISTVAVAERRAGAVAAISGPAMNRTEASWDIHRHLARAAAAEAATFIGPAAGQEDGEAEPLAARTAGGEDEESTEIYREFASAILAATAAEMRAGANVNTGADPSCPPPDSRTGTGAGTGVTTGTDGPAPDGRAPGTTSPAQAAAALATLVCLTPTYTEYIGEARAHNRHGDSVGAAYLRGANALMNDRMLPASATLAGSHTAELTRQFRRATNRADVVGLALVAAVGFAALVGTQVAAARWTRRRLNPALLAATALVIAGTAWPQLALAAERSALATASSEGYEVRGLLARVRNLALRAEGDVLYWRFAQSGDIAFDSDYDRTVRQLRCAAGGSDANDADDDGSSGGSGPQSGDGCATITARPLASGLIDLVEAASTAGTAAIGAADAPAGGRPPADAGGLPAAMLRFAALDNALTEADAAAEARFDAELASAQDALAGVAAGAGVLFGLAAILVAAGLEPRIREYR
ncbi:hypothetical protein UG55_103228 [Frankia sp. EI5c]|uniref:hypothetical protein n=1 Tax=Frankia sp. EI5c TaxID=683316 RepID=UPI0007C26C00|nr:hypothetical protein [Frankia sp. EI5c]OAA23995.1 hypothetical protein UG55_103228 [Frankia sp. EI5c]